MRRLALALALVATTARAQSTGGAGPSSSETAASNSQAALGVNKASNAPPSAVANIMIGPPAQSENCSLPVGGGLANLAIGGNLIWSRTDKGCDARRDAYALGFFVGRAAAIQRLCQRAGNWKAMKAAGTPCEGQTSATRQKP